jgi:hypothetical protein
VILALVLLFALLASRPLRGMVGDVLAGALALVVAAVLLGPVGVGAVVVLAVIALARAGRDVGRSWTRRRPLG